jgi:hypothetical protein
VHIKAHSSNRLMEIVRQNEAVLLLHTAARF